MEKEKLIETTNLYIIKNMLEIYPKKYIEELNIDELIKLFPNEPILKQIKNKLAEIEKAFETIIDKLNTMINIPNNSIYYLFTLLKTATPKQFNNKITYANNIYHDRKTNENLILNDKNNISENNIKHYLTLFFENKKAPLRNYIGIMTMIEILIRTIFLYYMYDETDSKKKTLKRYFLWMVINNYKNLFNMKNGEYRMAYYFDKFITNFTKNEKIKPFYNKNHTSNLKKYYKIVDNELKELELGKAQNILIFPYNKPNLNKTEFTSLPFNISIGKEKDKNMNYKETIFIAISTLKLDVQNILLIPYNTIISYKHI